MGSAASRLDDHVRILIIFCSEGTDIVHWKIQLCFTDKSIFAAQSLDLRYGWVPLLDQSLCRADYVYGDGNISDGMVCAGFLDEGVDSCDGDSGGPLACQRNGKKDFAVHVSKFKLYVNI